MIILRRIPMTALQTGLYILLSSGQTTPVYDDVPEDVVFPYITIGAFTCKRFRITAVDLYCHIRIKIISCHLTGLWFPTARKAQDNADR